MIGNLMKKTWLLLLTAVLALPAVTVERTLAEEAPTTEIKIGFVPACSVR
jgi:hypothetical protein